VPFTSGSWVRLLPVVSWLFLAALPNDTPAPPPPPGTANPEEAFEILGCTCDKAFVEGFRCDALPGFPDNTWVHVNAADFATSVADFAARVESVSATLPPDYYLALQGWADNRPIRDKKHWGDARLECRGGHDPADLVDNRNLAFLRSCELRRLLRRPLDKQIDLLPPIDFTEASKRGDPLNNYKGASYKAVVLFIVVPSRRVCGK
jgi:hypothetical protein